MKQVFRRPSPAMVVAIVALIAALGGTAVAGGALNKKKVNNIITNRAPGLSVKDSANLGGTAAGSFPKVTQFAYGEIGPTGGVKPPSSSAPPNRGILSATNPSTGLYCLDLAFSPTFGTGDGTGASVNGSVAMVDIPATNCPAGTDASVYVSNAAGTPTNQSFTVLLGGF
jgi:hypothetical protein